MNKQRKTLWGYTGLAGVLALVSTVSAAQTPDAVWQPYPMQAEVEALVPEAVAALDGELVGLWQKALQRPEVGTRLEAAEAFAVYAAQDIPGLAEAVGPALIEHYRAERDAWVRLALVRALIAMDARDAVSLGWAEVDDPALLRIADPALAWWGDTDAIPVWRARFDQRGISDAALISAARALDSISDESLPALVVEVLNDPTRSTSLKLALAETVTGYADEALFDTATDRIEGADTDRLIAAMLLGTAPSSRADEANKAARAMLGDGNPVVARLAFSSLDRIKQEQAGRVVGTLSKHADAELRQTAVAWIAEHLEPDDGVALLVARLGDPATRTRFAAGDALIDFALAGQRDEVIEALDPTLAGDDWRSLEQAATIVGRLDHEPAADRLIELLTHERSEVRIASATAMRRLAVESTRDALRTQAQRWLDQALKGAGLFADAEPLTQLALCLGELRDPAADGLFKSLAEKNATVPLTARRAGVWALGQLHAGVGDAESVRLFTARVNDRHPMEPEDPMLQAVAVLAIGRIAGVNQAASLKAWHASEILGLDVRYAAAAAHLEATGEALASLPPPRSSRGVWFLVPID